MLQLIYGTKGSGKSEYILKIAEKVWNETDKKVFVIVPEQYSYETERALVERLGIISPRTVEVLSFKRLFHYVCNNIGGALLPRLSEAGKTILISRAAKNCGNKLKMLKTSARYPGFSQILATLFSEFKRYNNSAEMVGDIADKLEENSFLKIKMQDISLLYGEYEKLISDTFTDPDDELTLLAKLLASAPDFFSDSIFLVDEFEGFTPQERGVIAELASQADVKITLCTDSLFSEGSGQTVFGMQIKTAQALSDICKNYKIKAEKPVFLERKLSDKEDVLHLERSLRRNTFEAYKGKTESFEIVSALNYSAELEFAAEKIISLVRDKGYRFRDFTVAARNIDTYKNIASEIFGKYDVPVYVSDKTPLINETPAFALLCAINIIIKNWNYDSVFAFLKTGYHNISDEETDILENYILKTGIRGSSWKSEKKWHYLPSGFNEEDVEKIDEIRRKVAEPLLILEKRFKEAENVRDCIKAVLEFMTAEGFADKIYACEQKFEGTESVDISARYKQIYDAVITSFDEIDSVTPENEKISAEDFYAMLSAAFETHTVGIIPTSADSVTVTDIQRCKAHNAKILFVVGVNEGVFPEIFAGEGIIKDEERKKLEECGLSMAPDTTMRMLDEEFMVYMTLLLPSEKLYLVYPLADNVGESLTPSSLIRKVKSLLPLTAETDTVVNEGDTLDRVVTEKTALGVLANEKSKIRDGANESPAFYALKSWFENHSDEQYEMVKKSADYRNTAKRLSDANLAEAYSNVVYTSVSRLEAFRKCPFMYFSKYMLDAKPREDTALKSVDTGTLMHSVVEELSYKVKEEFGSWKDVSDEWLEKMSEELADEKIAELNENTDIVEPRQFWAVQRVKNGIKASVQMIAAQLKAGEFVPMGYEISFDDNSKYKCIEISAGGKKVRLRGKIDRSDIYTDESGRKFIRVIDYKSGKREFRVDELYYGINLQLAVYLDSLTKQENGISAGMLYFRLFDPIVKTGGDISQEEANKITVKEYKADGLLPADSIILEKMDRDIQSGSSFLPVKFNTNGSIAAYSRVATYEQFENMNKYLKKALKKLGEAMLSGKTDISPIRYNKDSPCTYCDYKAMCHFDGALCNSYNRLPKLSEKEAWEKIEEGSEK